MLTTDAGNGGGAGYVEALLLLNDKTRSRIERFVIDGSQQKNCPLGEDDLEWVRRYLRCSNIRQEVHLKLDLGALKNEQGRYQEKRSGNSYQLSFLPISKPEAEDRIWQNIPTELHHVFTMEIYHSS